MGKVDKFPDLSRWKINRDSEPYFWAELDLPHGVSIKVTKMTSAWDIWVVREKVEAHTELPVTTAQSEVFARVNTMVEEYIARKQVELDEIYKAMFFREMPKKEE